MALFQQSLGRIGKLRRHWQWCCNSARALAFALLALLSTPESLAAPAEFDEYAVKAAFLYNFTQFIQWPATAFAGAKEPFVIGIVGESPFGDRLAKTFSDERVQDHPVVLRVLQPGDDPTGCHLIFFSRAARSHITAALRLLGAKPVLSVSETEQFCQGGGIINLTLHDKKVGFELNPSEAKAAGLLINANLKNLARVVETRAEQR